MASGGGGGRARSHDTNLLSRHQFSNLVCMEDWSFSGQLNVVCFTLVLYALVINENQLSYELLYSAISYLSSSHRNQIHYCLFLLALTYRYTLNTKQLHKEQKYTKINSTENNGILKFADSSTFLSHDLVTLSDPPPGVAWPRTCGKYE